MTPHNTATNGVLIDGMNCGELRALLAGCEDWEKVGIEVSINAGYRCPEYVLVTGANVSASGPRLRLVTQDFRVVKVYA